MRKPTQAYVLEIEIVLPKQKIKDINLMLQIRIAVKKRLSISSAKVRSLLDIWNKNKLWKFLNEMFATKAAATENLN